MCLSYHGDGGWYFRRVDTVPNLKTDASRSVIKELPSFSESLKNHVQRSDKIIQFSHL